MLIERQNKQQRKVIPEKKEIVLKKKNENIPFFNRRARVRGEKEKTNKVRVYIKIKK